MNPKSSISPHRSATPDQGRKSSGKYAEKSKERNNGGEGRKYSRSRSRSKSGSKNRNAADANGVTLYISNLPRKVDEEDLRSKFERFGKLSNLSVVKDPFTQDCRGFGFATFQNGNEATEAQEGMNKSTFGGRQLTVEKAKSSRGHQPTPGRYLGHYKSNNGGRSRSPYNKGRYDRHGGGRDRSHSRGRGERRGRNRSPSYSRGRSRDRSRNRSRSHDRGARRNKSRSRSRDRSRRH